MKQAEKIAVMYEKVVNIEKELVGDNSVEGLISRVERNSRFRVGMEANKKLIIGAVSSGWFATLAGFVFMLVRG